MVTVLMMKMKSFCFIATVLSGHFLLGTCSNHDNTSLRTTTTSSISWSKYCGCLESAVTDPKIINVKNCFRGFFRKNGQQAVKDAVQKYRGNRKLCFLPSKDGNEECKVWDIHHHWRGENWNRTDKSNRKETYRLDLLWDQRNISYWDETKETMMLGACERSRTPPSLEDDIELNHSIQKGDK